MNVSGSSNRKHGKTGTFLKNHRQVRSFSLRDGFHLSSFNEEKRKQMDAFLLSPPPITVENTSIRAPLSNTRIEEKREQQIETTIAQMDGEITRIFDLIDRQPPEMISHLESNTGHTVAEIGAITPGTAATITAASTRSHHSSCTLPEEYRQWLLYRKERPSDKEKERLLLEKMIAEELKISSSKDESQVRSPRPPTSSTCTSSMKASTRKKRQLQPQQPKPQTDVYVPIPIPLPTPVTTVLEKQEVVLVAPVLSAAPPRFSTRRSILKLCSTTTATALKTKRLSFRIKELRAFPEITDQILEETRQRKLQQFKEMPTCDNVIERNKQVIVHPVGVQDAELLQHKREEVLRRKTALEAERQQQIEQKTDRWNKKKLEFLQLQQKWLMTIHLCRFGQIWFHHLKQFDAEINLKLCISMVKRIQRFWRRIANASQVKELAKTVAIIQRFMRRSNQIQKARQRRKAVEMIIFSWHEFQDVKFRRLILRFRKYIGEFQFRWRQWKQITDARLELLLLYWQRIEKKHLVHFSSYMANAKRHGGGTSSNSTSSTSSPNKLQVGMTTSLMEDKRLNESKKRLSNAFVTVATVVAVSRAMKAQHIKEEMIALDSSDPNGGGKQSSNGSGSVRANAGRHLVDLIKRKNSSTITTTSTSSSSNSSSSSSSCLGQITIEIPTFVRLTLLRQVLSEKRRDFLKEKKIKHQEFQVNRTRLKLQQMHHFHPQHFNILEEMEEYKKFCFGTSLFLMLSRISEEEMIKIIQQAIDKQYPPFPPPPPPPIGTSAVKKNRTS